MIPKPVRQGCVARLKPGEYKRIPRSTPKPIGFYMSCPHCAAINPLVVHHLDELGVTYTEKSGSLHELSPVKCARCKKTIRIEAGRYVLD